VIRGINSTSVTRHPLYRTLFTNYDYKSHILSATNNVLLPLPAHQFVKTATDKSKNTPLLTHATVE